MRDKALATSSAVVPAGIVTSMAVTRLIETATVVPGSTDEPPIAALSSTASKSDGVLDESAAASKATRAMVAKDVGGSRGGKSGGGHKGRGDAGGAKGDG